MVIRKIAEKRTMHGQNPVFIPGPTNIPERLRHAMNVPTADHRSQIGRAHV